MADAPLHSGHRERLRSRFLETGITGFSEHELLELLLFYSIPRANTNSISHALLQRFDIVLRITLLRLLGIHTLELGRRYID